MSDVYSLMKYLTPYELDHIKFLAHNDEIPYQIINSQYKINKNDVKNLMRFMLNDQDYLKWKKIYNKSIEELPNFYFSQPLFNFLALFH